MCMPRLVTPAARRIQSPDYTLLHIRPKSTCHVVPLSPTTWHPGTSSQSPRPPSFSCLELPPSWLLAQRGSEHGDKMTCHWPPSARANLFSIPLVLAYRREPRKLAVGDPLARTRRSQGNARQVWCDSVCRHGDAFGMPTRLLASATSRSSEEGSSLEGFDSGTSFGAPLSDQVLQRVMRGPWLLSETQAQPTLTAVHVDQSAMPTGTSPFGFDSQPPQGSILVVRDDLLHPIASGNKLRKLDAIIPLLTSSGATHVVTCGGVQSAHTASVAAVCAERSIAAHLVTRGEPPTVPTGHCLMTHMFGTPHYVTRSEYANRHLALHTVAATVAGDGGAVATVDELAEADETRQLAAESASSVNVGRGEGQAWMGSAHLWQSNGANGGGCHVADDVADVEKGASGVHCAIEHCPRVAIIPEGGSCHLALWGVIRMILKLKECYPRLSATQCTIVVDSGTGATAVGCAAGVALLGLPWRVVGVMLAGDEGYYQKEAQELSQQFLSFFNATKDEQQEVSQFADALPLSWVGRIAPRRFGKVLGGEINACRRFAQNTGILLDPVYTLAAWEVASNLATGQMVEDAGVCFPQTVIVLHTGGGLGLFGLAQRNATAFLDPVK